MDGKRASAGNAHSMRRVVIPPGALSVRRQGLVAKPLSWPWSKKRYRVVGRVKGGEEI